MTTSPDPEIAGRLAEQLVDKALAACVNILPPMQSIYQWQGERRTGQECQLLIKTTRQRYAEVEAYIKGNHPYELPEIIAIPVETGSSEYLQWVTECCEENQ